MKASSLTPRPVAFLLLFALLAFPSAARAVPEETRRIVRSETGLSQELALRQVTLFSSGVGHFTHLGTVQAGESIDLAVSMEQLDDLLKTLTLESISGGTVRAVDYTTGDSLERVLSNLPVQPGETLQTLLASMIGEQLSVGAPPVAGRLVSAEAMRESSGGVERDTIRLTLLTADGLRTVMIGGQTSIAISDPVLRAQLAEALGLIRSSRATRDRTLTVRTAGTGPQELRATYVREMPVWKPTYRLVVDGDSNHLLQGWAIVENTTKNDWNNVALTLVAGDPVSFRMSLAEPIYQRRPQVPFPLTRPTRPTQFADAFPAESLAPSRASSPQAAFLSESDAPAGRGFAGLGVESAADTQTQGVFHRYVVREPVSIPAGGAAMVPIVQQRVPAELISVYDPAVNPTVPVAGIQLTNTTGAALSAGPLTVYDHGDYAGEAVLQHLGDDGERLLSFSLDRRTEVNRRVDPAPERITRVTIDRGVMTTSSVLRRESRYTIVSRDPMPRALLIQHRREGDWVLSSPTRPDQDYAGGYRFRLSLAAVETREFVVVEERARSETVTLSNISGDRIAAFLSQREIPAAVRDALVSIRLLQSELASAQAIVRNVEQRIGDIEREQQRIRSNMGVLAQNSDLYRRYVADLSAQEDRLVELRRELDTARQNEQNARRELDGFVSRLVI